MKTPTLFVPKFISSRSSSLALGVAISTVAIAIASAMMPQSAVAQSQGTVNPLEDINSRQSERDSFTGNPGGSGLSVFDMIHRSRLGVSDLDEANVQKNLDTATEEFRRQQLERLGNPQPVVPVNQPAPSGRVN